MTVSMDPPKSVKRREWPSYRQILSVGIAPFAALLVFCLFYSQNRTDVSRGPDLLLMSEEQMNFRHKSYHVGDEDFGQQWKEFVGPHYCPPVAKRILLKRRAGFRIFDRGHDVSFQAEIPEFLIESLFLKQLSQQLRLEYKSMAIQFTNVDWSLVRDGFREPTSSLQNWDGSLGIDIVHVSPDAVSILELHSEYTGGAHGNYALIGRSWIEENGLIREMELDDLFIPTSDWENRLVEWTLRELQQQGATWIIDDPFDSDLSKKFSRADLSQFTLSTVGIRFYFSPYHVGPYSDGVFSVLVPYSVVIDCISTESPARRFIPEETD